MSGASPTGLHQLIEGFRKRFGVPVVGGGVVGRGGGVMIEVIGQQRRGGSDPATVDDQWHVGSCAKATLYARLVEGGAAEWGVPINEFFPDLADDLDSGWSVPTIDELLVCRSGMRADLSRDESGLGR